VGASLPGTFWQVLQFVKRAIDSGIPFEHPEETIDTLKVRQLLQEAAREGVVLLKNDQGVLPLQKVKGKKIAVIGPNANQAFICKS
jgi:beta-glucosidase